MVVPEVLHRASSFKLQVPRRMVMDPKKKRKDRSRSRERVAHTLRDLNYPSAVISELVAFVQSMDNWWRNTNTGRVRIVES